MERNFKRVEISSTLFIVGLTAVAMLSAIGKLSQKVLTARAEPSTATLEQSVHSLLNQYRSRRELPPLRLDSQISRLARAHSQEMASGRVPFGHQGYDRRKQAIARTIPYEAFAENVAYNGGVEQPDRTAVAMWLQSPGHLKNIIGEFDRTGVGVSLSPDGKY